MKTIRQSIARGLRHGLDGAIKAAHGVWEGAYRVYQRGIDLTGRVAGCGCLDNDAVNCAGLRKAKQDPLGDGGVCLCHCHPPVTLAPAGAGASLAEAPGGALAGQAPATGEAPPPLPSVVFRVWLEDGRDFSAQAPDEETARWNMERAHRMAVAKVERLSPPNGAPTTG